jgi:hypothetical protein
MSDHRQTKSGSLRRWPRLLVLVGGCTGFLAVAAAPELDAVAGAHARIVWLQEVGTHGDFGAKEGRFKLMGLDSRDGQGEREILPSPLTFTRPLITADGQRVVFSLNRAAQVYVVNWDGTGLRKLTTGRAAALWREPETGHDWVCVQGTHELWVSPIHPIHRYRLDDPQIKVLVWNKSPVDTRENGSFQMSADGKRAAGLFPWPKAGVVKLPNKDVFYFGEGCWTSMAPDNSYRWWRFDGQHRNVIMFEADAKEGRSVNVNGAPGINGREVYHPRWTTHPRFFTITGPYKFSGGKAESTGEDTEVYLGRFAADFSKVDAWVKLTDNAANDYMADAWVEDVGQFKDEPVTTTGTPLTPRAPAEKISLTGKLVETTPVPTPESIAPYKKALVVSTYEVEQVTHGKLEAKKILVAQWGILDGKVIPGRDVTIGKSYPLLVEKFSAHPELEGERLVQDQTDFDLDLYVEVKP